MEKQTERKCRISPSVIFLLPGIPLTQSDRDNISGEFLHLKDLLKSLQQDVFTKNRQAQSCPVLVQDTQRNETARKRDTEVKDRRKANMICIVS